LFIVPNPCLWFALLVWFAIFSSLVIGIKRGAENTSVTHTFPALAFPVPTYGLKKSNSSSDVRGVCQSSEVILSEVEHPPEDVIGQGNKLAENLTPTLLLWKSKRKKPYWSFVRVQDLPMGIFCSFPFSLMHQTFV